MSVRRVAEPNYPNFPAEEVTQRCRRVQEQMRARTIDLLILSERENVVYFSGISSMAWVQKGVVPAVVLIGAEEPAPLMILPDFWLGTAEKTTWLPDFVLHHGSHSEPMDFANLVIGVIKEHGWQSSTIGYEAGLEMLVGMPLKQWEHLRSALASANWIDASDAIWDVRMIKSNIEIERLRRAAIATNSAQEVMRDHARTGMSELELGAVLRRAMLQDDGGEQDRLFLNMRAGSDRYSMTDTYPKNRPLQSGDLLVCDAGLWLEGYASDTARVMSIGKASQLHSSIYTRVVEARAEAVRELKAGVPAAAMYRAVRSVFDHAELPVHIDMVGHGIGLDVHEPPMLSPINETPLQKSMVVCIEPWVTLPDDQGVLVIEDTFVVQQSGCEQLTLPNAEELWVIGE